MNQRNETQVLDTLRSILNILNKNNIEYRFLGSIITCALRNEVYRKINDLDLLIDVNKQELFASELSKLGFSKKIKNHLRLSEQFNLNIYQHPALLETSFFGLDFLNDGSANLVMPHIKANVDKDAIRPTKYFLKDLEFVGIPAEVVYKTILYSISNPKRKLEFEIFNRLAIKPYSGKIFSLKLYGLNIEFLPRLANFILEIIGKTRVMLLNRNCDIWK